MDEKWADGTAAELGELLVNTLVDEKVGVLVELMAYEMVVASAEVMAVDLAEMLAG